MELSKAADTLKELGHPTRLSVYRELVKAGLILPSNSGHAAK